MDRKSIGARGDYSFTPTTGVGNYFSEPQLREEFAEIVGNYTAQQLSKAGGVTIDAAKKWLAGKSLPNTASTFNLAQRLQPVRGWVQKRSGIGSGGEAQMQALRQIVADEVREIVKKPAAPSAEPIEDRRAFVVRDLFERRRA